MIADDVPPRGFDDTYDEYSVAYVHRLHGQTWPVRHDATIYRSREDAQESLAGLNARVYTGHYIVVSRTVAVTEWEDNS